MLIRPPIFQRRVAGRNIVPIFYQCQRCTACCRWPGQVRLTDEEITRFAAFKGLSEYDFIQRFTRLAADRRGLTLLGAICETATMPRLSQFVELPWL